MDTEPIKKAIDVLCQFEILNYSTARDLIDEARKLLLQRDKLAEENKDLRKVAYRIACVYCARNPSDDWYQPHTFIHVEDCDFECPECFRASSPEFAVKD